LIGSDSNWASVTDLSLESVSVKSGAFCPTSGAPVDAGSHDPMTKNIKRSPASSNTPNAAANELKIFERIPLSGLNARRRPKDKRTNAIANRTRLAQGNSRVSAHRTKRSG